MSSSLPIRPKLIEARGYRVPIETPLVTSFGIMRDRPCVLVRVVDADGAEGWGEAWCNWPTVAAEYRAQLIDAVVSPLLLGREFADPVAAFEHVSRALEVLVVQTAEVGPIAQAVAGVDIAIWDLHARRAGLPLYRALQGGGGTVVERTPAYASGVNPDQPEATMARARAEGHRAFKLKVGFARERDLRNIAAVREVLDPADRLMVDANQAWDLATAKAMSREIERFDLDWLEEPIRADQPWSAWRELKAATSLRLAGGENLRGDDFDAAIAEGVFGVVQPDVAKWGGVSGCFAVARKAIAAGAIYCPHWLASGIGLNASLHLLAAAGGGGLLEMDVNPNPLRDMLGGDLIKLVEGHVAVPQGPGLGIAPDLAALERYRTWPAR
jgi:D-galactarolactone cycloisomerase